MIGALQRPGRGNHRAVCCHAAGERADGVGRNLREGRSPVGIFRLAVSLTHDVGAYTLEAGAIAREEVSIVQTISDKCMGQREQHRCIATWPDRNPFRRGASRPVLAVRADGDYVHAIAHEFRQPIAIEMPGTPALGHLHVLGIAAAEQHHQLGVARDRQPGGKRPGDRLRAADDVRQKRQRGAEAVIGSLVDEAAERRHEAAQLRTRLMENSGRAPALRARHDGIVTVIALDARKFAGD